MQIFFSPTLWLWIFIECVQLRNDKTLPNNLSIGKTEAFIGRYNACKVKKLSMQELFFAILKMKGKL